MYVLALDTTVRQTPDRIRLDPCDVAFNFSPLRLVFSFWLAVHLCLAMQFILSLEVEPTYLTSQNHNSREPFSV